MGPMDSRWDRPSMGSAGLLWRWAGGPGANQSEGLRAPRWALPAVTPAALTRGLGWGFAERDFQGGNRAGAQPGWRRCPRRRKRRRKEGQDSAALLGHTMSGAGGNGTPQVSPQEYELAGKNKVVAVDGVKVKLQIWDTAGQERFRSVTHAYYRDAQALLLLYDITSKMSFDNIRAWLTEIHEYAQKDVVIMLLGNKADVSSERMVRTEDGASLAREYGVPFMETSAKTGMNVELAFLAIARELKQRAVQPPDEPRFQIHDYIEAQQKRSGCCAFI
ncbi:ras-related protein Rab-37 isoform X14 [Gallus gallus]|uniref:ras-related protein Rab-37 isoform X14 n=1 Tax=Gallus gallus TaxID=9031 RepID=UPI001AE1BC23|nr:ras-related protein Rab-37 isoform X14 [Gallus gallus]